MKNKNVVNKDLVKHNHHFKNISGNEEGFVLVVSLVLLLVITLMGILALSSSTTEVMIAGNQRIVEINEISADGGKDLSKPIINDVVYYDRVDTNKFTQDKIVIDNELNNELQLNDSDDDGIENVTSNDPENSSDALMNPDINFRIPSNDPNPRVTVSIDVDYLFSAHAAGSAIEFGSGTEGMGKGMSGGSLVYYKANSFSRWASSSERAVGTLYRYVVKY